MKRKRYLLFFLGVTFFPGVTRAQNDKPLYKDPKQPVEVRVQDLLSRMTPEEKFWQCFMIPESRDAQDFKGDYTAGIFGLQVSTGNNTAGENEQLISYNSHDDLVTLVHKINAIQHFFVEKTRLGIPIIPFDEALHGLMRRGGTVFPQAIGLAAAFNPDLMREVSTAIAEEAKLTGIRQILSPVINLADDVRWGRTEETYGEDPYVTSVMGVQFIQPFEESGIIMTPKHFLANVGAGGRDSYPIHWSKRYLEETHLVPFYEVIKKAKSRSLMTAYNLLDGRPSTANHWLLTQKLKKEWDFSGFVISDAAAVGGSKVLHFTASDYPNATAQAMNAGLDVIFQTEYNQYKLFIPPFLDGRISAERIDDAVARVLRAKFELGLFEQPYVSTADIKKLKQLDHTAIAEKAAVESFVLLQNKNQTLPIPQQVKNLLIIGRDAKDVRLGGYAGPGENKISILEGLQKLASAHKLNVTYVKGTDWDVKEFVTIPDSYLSADELSGLKGSYFASPDLSGSPVGIRQDKNIDFKWTLSSPLPRVLPTDEYSVKWTGTLTAPKTGTYKIGLEGNDGFRLMLDGDEIVNRWEKTGYSKYLKEVSLKEGQSYAVEIDFHEMRGNGRVHLVWDYQLPDYQKDFNEALQKVKNADYVVYVAGIHEGEFQDRGFLSLPGNQELFIEEASQLNKPIAVVLVGGSAIKTTHWKDKVGAILDVWYPGEQGGIAVAKTLLGEENPSGKLPVTFAAEEGQLPLTYNHQPTGRGDDYYDLSGEPLYPFGFGLSYTKFEISDLQLNKEEFTASDVIEATLHIRNVGKFAGKEVLQLYSHQVLSFEARPIVELKAFKKVELKPGEEKVVKIQLPVEQLKALDGEQRWKVNPGSYRLMIGNSSKNLPLKKTITIK